MFSKERITPFNKEKFEIYASATLIFDANGNLYLQLRDKGAPTEPHKIDTFGGGRELHEDSMKRGYKSRELTIETAEREVTEELSLNEDQIESIKPFAWQSFNLKDDPDKGYSVHVVKLKEGVGFYQMQQTEGSAIIKIDDIDNFIEGYHEYISPSLLEMLERNKDRIRKLML